MKSLLVVTAGIGLLLIALGTFTSTLKAVDDSMNGWFYE